jgi:hypothetical protein
MTLWEITTRILVMANYRALPYPYNPFISKKRYELFFPSPQIAKQFVFNYNSLGNGSYIIDLNIKNAIHFVKRYFLMNLLL